MKQSELILKTASISGVQRSAVEHVLKVAGDVVTAELFEGGEAVLPGLGKLVSVDVAARGVRNPRTGEPMTLPAHRAVKFRPAKALKGALAEG